MDRAVLWSAVLLVCVNKGVPSPNPVTLSNPMQLQSTGGKCKAMDVHYGALERTADTTAPSSSAPFPGCGSCSPGFEGLEGLGGMGGCRADVRVVRVSR